MGNRSNFNEILNDIMLDENLNITQLAKMAGIAKSTLSLILKGTTLPSMKSLIKLAKTFKCSIDYLLGRVEDKTPYPKAKAVSNFYERFTSLMKENKLKYSKLKKLIDLPSTEYFWRNGSQPKIPHLVSISDYFCVSTDYLLGLTDKK